MMHTRPNTRPTRTVRVRLTRLGAVQRMALVLPTLAVLGALGASHASGDEATRQLPACATDEGPDGQLNRGCVYDARHLGNGMGRSFVIRRDADARYGTLVYVSHARAHELLFGVQA